MNKIKILFVVLGMCLLGSCDDSMIITNINPETTEEEAIEIIKSQLGTEDCEITDKNDSGNTNYSFEDGERHGIKYSEIKLSIKDGKVLCYSYSLDKKHEKEFIRQLNEAGFKTELSAMDGNRMYSSMPKTKDDVIMILAFEIQANMNFIRVFGKESKPF